MLRNNPPPRGAWQDMSTAPKDGTAIRLLLKDGFGEYPFEPCEWDGKSWVNYKSGKVISPKVIGWMHLSERKAVDAKA